MFSVAASKAKRVRQSPSPEKANDGRRSNVGNSVRPRTAARVFNFLEKKVAEATAPPHYVRESCHEDTRYMCMLCCNLKLKLKI